PEMWLIEMAPARSALIRNYSPSTRPTAGRNRQSLGFTALQAGPFYAMGLPHTIESSLVPYLPSGLTLTGAMKSGVGILQQQSGRYPDKKGLDGPPRPSTW
ncbi:MAG TPA: hypothetical protein VKA15_17070, partial [Isosphaeraceae bacterium]|nr:hypothetical protein [Isosphaeraceae bacterium]